MPILIDEQRGATAHHIAGLADDRERRDERRRDAGGDDQRRQRAHDAHAEIGAGLLLVAGLLSRVWMKPGISIVNRPNIEAREHHEQQAEQRDDPRLVERRLQVEALADGAGRDAGRV